MSISTIFLISFIVIALGVAIYSLGSYIADRDSEKFTSRR